jgi:hypothetical protein
MYCNTYKINTGIQIGDPLMYNLTYPFCKQFLALLPKLLYHSHLQTVT